MRLSTALCFHHVGDDCEVVPAAGDLRARPPSPTFQWLAAPCAACSVIGPHWRMEGVRRCRGGTVEADLPALLDLEDAIKRTVAYLRQRLVVLVSWLNLLMRTCTGRGQDISQCHQQALAKEHLCETSLRSTVTPRPVSFIESTAPNLAVPIKSQ